MFYIAVGYFMPPYMVGEFSFALWYSLDIQQSSHLPLLPSSLHILCKYLFPHFVCIVLGISLLWVLQQWAVWLKVNLLLLNSTFAICLVFMVLLQFSYTNKVLRFQGEIHLCGWCLNIFLLYRFGFGYIKLKVYIGTCKKNLEDQKFRVPCIIQWFHH